MTPFLFFLLQSSLIFDKVIVAGSGIFDHFYFLNEDDEYAEIYNSNKLPQITAPSCIDLNSLSINGRAGDKTFNRKRRMENDSPISPIGLNSSSNWINEYSRPSQVLTVEDDYFFLDLESSEINFENIHHLSSQVPKAQVKSDSKSKEIIQPKSILKVKVSPAQTEGKEVLEEDDTTRLRADSGLYESIVNNFFTVLSSFSPKSVRKIFEPQVENNSQVKLEPLEEISIGNQVMKKESNDTSQKVGRRYKSFHDLEKAEHLCTNDEDFKYDLEEYDYFESIYSQFSLE